MSPFACQRSRVARRRILPLVVLRMVPGGVSITLWTVRSFDSFHPLGGVLLEAEVVREVRRAVIQLRVRQLGGLAAPHFIARDGHAPSYCCRLLSRQATTESA